MTDTDKYAFPLTDYGTTGWNGIIKGSIEDVDTHLHTRFLATLGETVAIGDALYLKSDGKYWKAKAAAGMLPCDGFAIEVGNADDEIRGQRVGPMDKPASAATLTVGAKVYVDVTTAGKITQTKPTAFAQAVGRAIATDEFFVEIEDVSMIHYGTEDPPTPTGYQDGIIYYKYEV